MPLTTPGQNKMATGIQYFPLLPRASTFCPRRHVRSWAGHFVVIKAKFAGCAMMELLRVVSCEDDMAEQQNQRARITGVYNSEVSIGLLVF